MSDLLTYRINVEGMKQELRDAGHASKADLLGFADKCIAVRRATPDASIEYLVHEADRVFRPMAAAFAKAYAEELHPSS